jgi:hypothetical protein
LGKTKRVTEGKREILKDDLTKTKIKKKQKLATEKNQQKRQKI